MRYHHDINSQNSAVQRLCIVNTHFLRNSIRFRVWCATKTVLLSAASVFWFVTHCMYNMTHTYLRSVWLMCARWLIHLQRPLCQASPASLGSWLTFMYDMTHANVQTFWFIRATWLTQFLRTALPSATSVYWVATISRLLKIIGLISRM